MGGGGGGDTTCTSHQHELHIGLISGLFADCAALFVNWQIGKRDRENYTNIKKYTKTQCTSWPGIPAGQIQLFHPTICLRLMPIRSVPTTKVSASNPVK